MKRLMRVAVRLVLVGAVLWAVRAGLKRWIDGPDLPVSTEPWPPIPSGPSVVKSRGVADRGPVPATTPIARVTRTTEAAPPGEPAAAKPGTGEAAAKSGPGEAEMDSGADPTEDGSIGPAPAKKVLKAKAAKKAATWVAPSTDGSAPASHPVKAKVSSRIYHLPGMAFYERTSPDRCYPTAEAAEADGFSRAKR